MDYALLNTPLIDQGKFEELKALLPPENWDTMSSTLFAEPDGDVPTLLAMLAKPESNKVVGDQAHKVKGAALLIGLQRLGELCALLERQYRATDDHLSNAIAHSALQTTGAQTAQALAQQLGQ